jgi:limonene-1,2-epoxide hydrolase
MIVEGMADLQGLDSELLKIVERLETACLCEALQPGSLERFLPHQSIAFQEPADDQLVQVVQAAAITLGRLTGASRANLAAVCAVVENFGVSQLHGSSASAALLRGSEPEHFVRQMVQLRVVLLSEAGKKFFLSDDARKMLADRRPSVRSVVCVSYALAATIGNMARVRGWHPKDAQQIIQRAYDGVFAGEAEREKQGSR